VCPVRGRCLAGFGDGERFDADALGSTSRRCYGERSVHVRGFSTEKSAPGAPVSPPTQGPTSPRRSARPALVTVATAFGAGALVLTASVAALATGPVFHEYVAPDPKEDVTLGTFTAAGQFPASVESPSGLISAPDTLRPPSATDRAYGSSRTSQDSVFYPDADTRRPDKVQYEEPFSPSVMPFKRMSVFDSVAADFGLRVQQPTLRKLSVGGVVGPQDEPFYADITVDVAPGESVRIPSVSAGARVLRLHTVPETSVELFRDGAENWFVKSPSRQRVRLLLQLAAPRTAFGGPFHDVPWSSLPPTPPLSPNVQASADAVNAVIGVSRRQSFATAVGALVSYYRSFAESAEPLAGKGDLYTQIALSRQGVCRHRAFAFTVSALALGIPTRLVTNEAHAWVEVDDGRGFRRIDLGGAAVQVDDHTAEAKIPHKAPPDPFAWPTGKGSSAGELAARTQRERDAQADPGGQPGAVSSARTAASGRAPGAGAPPPQLASDDDNPDARPHAELALTVTEQRVSRNDTLHVKGTVRAAGDPCVAVRVDIVLGLSPGQAGGAHELSLGTLATDEKGAFDGSVVVPTSLALGEYDVFAHTPGDSRCGAGKSTTPPSSSP
jgi:hypothetical protein